MGDVALLPGHRDADAFLRVDEVVVVVDADVELDPVDLSGEAAAIGGVVGGHGCAGLVADVGGLVGREDHRLRGVHPPTSRLGAVVVQGDVAPLGEAASVIGELHAHLVRAGGDQGARFRDELLDT